MFLEPETWVAIAFVILMAVFAYLGVHRTVLQALDKRSERIKAELDDARRLKDEAAKLLGEYKTRRASAEREAQEIISSAKAEAGPKSPPKPRPRWKTLSLGGPGPGRQDRARRSPGGRRCPCRRRQRRGYGRLGHPVAVGQGLGCRRPARQGHRRGQGQAELSPYFN